MTLTTHDLAIGYKNGRRDPMIVGQNIDVTLENGQLIALIGPNGAGKSTLLRTLAGMLPPLAGRVTLDGDDIHKIDAGTLARRLSVVLTGAPDVGLLTGYALVSLGRHPYTNWSGALSDHDEKIIREAVHLVGAEAYAHKPVTEMSDGQRQKIMIARALAQEPQVMILDEPTAYLDLPRRVEIMHLLKRLTRQTNRAILLSIHDLDLALRTADRIWLMGKDAPLITGTPEDLVLNGTFERAFHKDGVMFDASAGSFHIPSRTTGEIRLIGDGLVRTWTERALNRIGWQVVDDAHVDARIAIIDDDPPCWRLHLTPDANPREFTSISELLIALERSPSVP